RVWIYASVTAWIVLPICFVWRPGFNVNRVRGPLCKEQHIVAPEIYLAAYMLALPLLVYLLTHRVVDIWDGCRDRIRLNLGLCVVRPWRFHETWVSDFPVSLKGKARGSAPRR